jgi:AsmA protein
MGKKILIGVGIVVVVLILIALVLPMFIDANKFKPTLESDLSAALGRKVEIGNISLSIFSGGVSVDNVTIADDPAFSQSPFLTAKKLAVGVALMPLIFSKRLQVTSFTIDEPQVTLLHSATGKWNFSSLGASAANAQQKTAASNPPPSGSSPGTGTSFAVEKLKLSNGTITVGRAGNTGAAVKVKHYEDVDLNASDLSLATQFPFTLTAKTPGGGSVKVDGKAGPINSTDASMTPLSVTIGVENLDLAATGFIDPSSGLGGLVDFNAQANSDGHEMTSKGTAKASKIKLTANASPATVPINIDYATNYDLQKEAGTLTEGNVHIGKALAALGGAYDTAGETTTLHMKLDGKATPVPDLEGVLPAVGVKLPEGASLQTGTLDMTLAISGPVDKPVIEGPINLQNAKLAGFNLMGKLGAIAQFAGIGKGGSGSDTEIQSLTANLREDPEGTHLQNLVVVAPALGTITGDANVGPTGQLNCKMVAKLGGSASPMGAATSALSSFTGGGAKGGGIPFKITGTTSKPIFTPDFGGMTQGAAATPKNAASAAQGMLGGLLKKKKNQ